MAYALAIHLFFAGVEVFEFGYGQTYENIQFLEVFSREGTLFPIKFLPILKCLLSPKKFDRYIVLESLIFDPHS